MIPEEKNKQTKKPQLFDAQKINGIAKEKKKIPNFITVLGNSISKTWGVCRLK